MSLSDRKSRQRKRRSRNGVVEIANALLTLVVIGIVGLIGAALWGLNEFHAEGPTTTEEVFLIERGNGLNTIATRLAEQGLIDSNLIFRVGTWAMRRDWVIEPGEYTIPAGASMADILELITEGEPKAYFVTVPEGETSFQVAMRINDPAQNLTGDPVSVPPEGSILPGRYDYFPRDTRQSVLDQMTAAMDKARAEVWTRCDPTICGADAPLKDEDDLVILASIIEKETGVASERPQVAGLFVNRLKRGMKLQTDPTIIYGITKGTRILEGGITARQKAEATPYNTYVIDGLPPGPIANPGIESLEAAANPADTDFLYMMAVTPNKPSDGHAFAVTLEEHQANEAKYRAQERALSQSITTLDAPRQ